MINYSESSIPMQIDKILSDRNYGWSDYCSEATIKTIFEGIAVFLGKVKSKDNPVALVFKDIYDKFVFAGYVQFHKQEEDENDQGSWTLNYTFAESDIDFKSWTIYYYPDSQVADQVLTDVGYSQFGLVFKFRSKDDNDQICEGSPQEIFAAILTTIYDYMRANVTIDPVLNFPNYFVATAELNGDNEGIYVGFEPSALLKQHIKDDATASTNNAEIPVRTE